MPAARSRSQPRVVASPSAEWRRWPGAQGRGSLLGRPHKNWPGESSGSPFHTTATTSPGSITVHPISRSRRTRPSGRTSTPVSFLFWAARKPTWPILLTSMEIDPGFPMRGLSRSQIVSPVMNRHLQVSLRARCPATAARSAASCDRGRGHRRLHQDPQDRLPPPGPGPHVKINCCGHCWQRAEPSGLCRRAHSSSMLCLGDRPQMDRDGMPQCDIASAPSDARPTARAGGLRPWPARITHRRMWPDLRDEYRVVTGARGVRG